jgi:hypothetical protein
MDVFRKDSVEWNSVLARSFTIEQISALRAALDSAMTEASARGFDVPLDMMLRLLDAVEGGERNPEKLKALVLAGWNVAKDSPVE